MKEINSLKDFVNENRDCIQEFFGIKRDGDLIVENDDKNEGSQFFDDQIQRDPEMANLMRDQQAKEQDLQDKLNAILVETKEQTQN